MKTNNIKGSMELLQSSNPASDPLSSVLDVLGARITRRSRFEAAGEWALSFPSLNRLKFTAILRGDAWMMLPGCEPQPMRAGDVCLIGRTDYVIASDPALSPLDGSALYEAAGSDVLRLGGEDVIGIGGSVTFAGENAGFFLDMLPDFVIIPRSTSGSDVISTVLMLMEKELGRDAFGSGLITARLADVLLVEAVRDHADRRGRAGMGWLGALLDPRLGRALEALHADVSHAWTVSELAKVAGMSRAAFSAEFAKSMGHPPMTYLRKWRLALARTALGRGDKSVGEVGRMVGYTSPSAFSQAFRQGFGRSPKGRS